jgi:hypothetical protein
LSPFCLISFTPAKRKGAQLHKGSVALVEVGDAFKNILFLKLCNLFQKKLGE